MYMNGLKHFSLPIQTLRPLKNISPLHLASTWNSKFIWRPVRFSFVISRFPHFNKAMSIYIIMIIKRIVKGYWKNGVVCPFKIPKKDLFGPKIKFGISSILKLKHFKVRRVCEIFVNVSVYSKCHTPEFIIKKFARYTISSRLAPRRSLTYMVYTNIVKRPTCIMAEVTISGKKVDMVICRINITSNFVSFVQTVLSQPLSTEQLVYSAGGLPMILKMGSDQSIIWVVVRRNFWLIISLDVFPWLQFCSLEVNWL